MVDHSGRTALAAAPGRRRQRSGDHQGRNAAARAALLTGLLYTALAFFSPFGLKKKSFEVL